MNGLTEIDDRLVNRYSQFRNTYKYLEMHMNYIGTCNIVQKYYKWKQGNDQHKIQDSAEWVKRNLGIVIYEPLRYQ